MHSRFSKTAGNLASPMMFLIFFVQQPKAGQDQHMHWVTEGLDSSTLSKDLTIQTINKQAYVWLNLQYCRSETTTVAVGLSRLCNHKHTPPCTTIR